MSGNRVSQNQKIEEWRLAYNRAITDLERIVAFVGDTNQLVSNAASQNLTAILNELYDSTLVLPEDRLPTTLPVPIAEGGTGATTVQQAKINLGIPSPVSFPISVAQGGTGANTSSQARINLGVTGTANSVAFFNLDGSLGSVFTIQNSNTISGLTNLPNLRTVGGASHTLFQVNIGGNNRFNVNASGIFVNGSISIGSSLSRIESDGSYSGTNSWRLMANGSRRISIGGSNVTLEPSGTSGRVRITQGIGIRNVSGTASSTAYGFEAEEGLGIYRSASGTLAISTDSAQRALFNNNGVTVTGNISTSTFDYDLRLVGPTIPEYSLVGTQNARNHRWLCNSYCVESSIYDDVSTKRAFIWRNRRSLGQNGVIGELSQDGHFTISGDYACAPSGVRTVVIDSQRNGSFKKVNVEDYIDYGLFRRIEPIGGGVKLTFESSSIIESDPDTTRVFSDNLYINGNIWVRVSGVDTLGISGYFPLSGGKSLTFEKGILIDSEGF